MAYLDKQRQRDAQRAHYAADKPTYKARARAHTARQQLKIRAILTAAKAVPCADCGIQYPEPVMEFDHIRGEKSMNVSEMRSGSLSLARVLAEIAKCEVRCANCHRLRTWSAR